LKNIQKDNGGSGNLTDWNNSEKVNKAIQTFQKAHYDKIDPYRRAVTGSDQGKA